MNLKSRLCIGGAPGDFPVRLRWCSLTAAAVADSHKISLEISCVSKQKRYFSTKRHGFRLTDAVVDGDPIQSSCCSGITR